MGDAPPRGRFRAIKMSALPRAIYKLDVIAVKISKGLLIEWDKLILKLIWKGKKDTNSITQEENTKCTVLCYRKTHITFTILTFLIV